MSQLLSSPCARTYSRAMMRARPTRWARTSPAELDHFFVPPTARKWAYRKGACVVSIVIAGETRAEAQGTPNDLALAVRVRQSRLSEAASPGGPN